MSGLLSRVVTRLSAYPSAAGTYTNTDVHYDFAVAGMPFLAAPDEDRPLERATAEYRKDQFDSSSEPGEQSLATWWLRSQSSFHAGAGIVYEEPDSSYPLNVFRYADSEGVDVWTPGEVTLLPDLDVVTGIGGAPRLAAGADGDYFLVADGTDLTRYDGSTLTPTAVTSGAVSAIKSLVTNGTSYYVAAGTEVRRGAISGGAGAVIYNTTSSDLTLGWAKQRLMLGDGNKLYELDAVGTGGPALPTAKYTHPSTLWQWTAFAESAQAIYAAGYAGNESAIYKLTLDTSGVVPITQATATAQLPSGERVLNLFGYLGDFVVIATNRGVRISTVDSNGDLAYGPLTIEFTGDQQLADGVALTGRDRFIYAGAYRAFASGDSGVYRIDLGTQIDFRKYAYAKDVRCTDDSTAIYGLLFTDQDDKLVVVTGDSLFIESDDLVESGYLTTGRIRMHTLEPKLFKFIRYRGEPLVGSVQISAVEPDGDVQPVVTFSAPGTHPYDEAAMPTSLGPQEYVSLRFTLGRDTTDTTTGPNMSGYQLKVLPAAKRQRLFRIPLLCFDFEKDQTGTTVGSEGNAITRLEALELLEEAGDLVTLTDLSRVPSASHLCVIDQVYFRQTAAPSQASGWGGYLYVTMRSVT